PRGKIVIDPGLPAWVAEQLRLKRARRERPSMQGRSAEAQRVLQALIRAGAEAIDRNGEAFYTEFSHGLGFAVGVFAAAPGPAAVHSSSHSSESFFVAGGCLGWFVSMVIR